MFLKGKSEPLGWTGRAFGGCAHRTILYRQVFENKHISKYKRAHLFSECQNKFRCLITLEV